MTDLTVIETASPNHNARPGGQRVDMLVLHYTETLTALTALDLLRAPTREVSAHYLVEEDGRIHRLVAETRRAWHAGVAAWRGARNINARSIGIEIVNPGHSLGYRPFPAAQMAAVTALAHDILARNSIPARNVVAHSDIGKSGLHGNTVPVNGRRGRPQGKCHRKQTAAVWFGRRRGKGERVR